MIKEIDSYSAGVCCGGEGECQCMGTRDPAEAIFGAFRKITLNENECRLWCIQEKRGTRWRFIKTSYFYPLSAFGFGGTWHQEPTDHIKSS